MGEQAPPAHDDEASPAAAARHALTLLRDGMVTDRLARSTSPTPGRAPRTGSTPPASLDIIDHLTRAQHEVAAYTRTVAPDAGPAPRGDYITWAQRHTAHLHGAEARLRDTLLHRQALEHAIAAGDHQVVRPLRCPTCRCFSLLWQHALHRAACVRRTCADDQGGPSVFSLAQLAEDHVRGIPRRAAT